ncbi:MAG: glycoside hydrolase family 3 C-terminal domain-containing protein [Acidobacteria bacterium]|nr:glycoside hydrolase family 3 C-terminal domain-containing protein [Acidobacteriota bacterium]
MNNTLRRSLIITGIITVVVCLALTTQLQHIRAQEPDYRNPNLPIERRVQDLLSRMTIEEKVAQMQTLWVRKPQEKRPNGNMGDRGDFSAAEAAVVMKYGIGEIARQRERTDARRGAMYANAVQKWLKENTRLGIPAILHDEILHGLMAVGGTHFPTPISLASSWDTELITKIFTAAALETRIRGSHHVLGPNLDLARDPRWGRTEETYGEDPYLVSRMGVAAIKAIQGPGPNVDGEHVIATAKHFAAHGQPEGGTNTAPGNFSERVLREVFLPPFEAAVKEAGVLSVMPSYNEIDGVPSHKNIWLLEKLLRQEWGFRGLVAADYNGITELVSRHKVAVDRAEAAQQALKAGVDIELPDPAAYPLLPQLVSEGKVSMAAIDQSVARVLRAKFQLGLFENPYVDVERAVRLTNSQAHRTLAAEAARRSLVLLKNEGSLLPLDRSKLSSIAVIGPNAAGVHLGGYSDDPQRGISVLQGVRDKLGNGVKVNYAEGCKITQEGGNWWNDKSQPADPAVDAKLIAEAVEVAKASDVVLLVVGGNEDTSKEAWADNHLGDRDTLDLVGRQNDLVKAIVETGKPVAVLLINSAPLSINYIAEKVPAILEGFYLGQETGVAVADVLFGDHNPGGKLAVSFARTVGQLPIYYNHKPTAKRGYLYANKEPLYPFGFGLSYTTFEYSDLKVTSPQIGPNGTAEVSVTVKNTGARAGDEIIQLYIRDVVSSVTRPVMELKDFRRISLASGESKTVTFSLTPDKLSFLDINMNRIVEPGVFEILVGTSSVKVQKTRLEVIAK